MSVPSFAGAPDSETWVPDTAVVAVVVGEDTAGDDEDTGADTVTDDTDTDAGDDADDTVGADDPEDVGATSEVCADPTVTPVLPSAPASALHPVARMRVTPAARAAITVMRLRCWFISTPFRRVLLAGIHSPFTSSGRPPVDQVALGQPGSLLTEAADTPADVETMQIIRAWARENGFNVSDQGTVPNKVITAYQAR